MSATEPIKVVADIIQEWMGLSDGQVMLAYQRYPIPTKGLFIVLTSIADTPMHAETFIQDADAGGQEEVAQTYMLHDIQIDLLSFGPEARQRRTEVIMALNSIYSQQQQVANEIKISRLTTPMQDTSFLESTEYLNRFTTRIRVTAVTELVKADPDYYDAFSGELNLDPETPSPVTVNPAVGPS